MNEITETDHDNLADIAWWIKGALDTSGETAFGYQHYQTLRKIMENWKEEYRRQEK